MIIQDLEHLDSIFKEKNVIQGSNGFTFISPQINVNTLVKAFAEPPQLLMNFGGQVLAGDYAFLQVNQMAYVRNMGFGPSPS
ncbi:hypothetical protein PCC7424_3513 [Gloeothece citriformis PCC 7424]|uniref:Uncharacterized protein n=1 Tax=Gloeothece citriformis (strain PCC 7424) TaxID=65393 RepID=B7KGH8_GLOC7|nr:hypothetical protein [Gloeothece citriformis]ACK71905.1 hypothetical protein PCC7424_3513 [Gloeothece citriformis PCC 7424]